MKKVDRSYGKAGFTILEMVTVLVILAVLAVVFMGGMQSRDAYDLKSAADDLRGRIRFAQLKSMNTNAVWGIYFSDGQHYALFRNGSTGDTVLFPGAEENPVNLSSLNVTVSGYGATGVISFDERGKPCTDAGGATLQAGTRTLTVSVAGGGSETVSIQPNTGYVP